MPLFNILGFCAPSLEKFGKLHGTIKKSQITLKSFRLFVCAAAYYKNLKHKPFTNTKVRKSNGSAHNESLLCEIANT